MKKLENTICSMIILGFLGTIGTIAFLDHQNNKKLENNNLLVSSIYNKASGTDKLFDAQEQIKFLDYFGFTTTLGKEDRLHLTPSYKEIYLSIRTGEPTPFSLGKFGGGVNYHERKVGVITIEKAAAYLREK